MKIRCPACDFENEENTKFCSNCNEPLVKPKTPNATNNPYIKINKKISRKLVLGIFVPVFMFFIFYAIAYYIGADTISVEGNNRFSREITRTYYYGQETWPIWIIYLISSCVFEYILFKDKDISINKLGLILKRIFKI